MTQWKDVPSFEGMYLISEYGAVVSIRRGKVMAQRVTKNGYSRVSLSVSGVEKHFLAHRLVAMAFVDGYSEELEVNHVDGNKLNNHYSNLEWVTRAKNTEHAINTRLRPKSLPVVAIPIGGDVGFCFRSSRHAAKNGFDAGSVNRCISGLCKQHLGYKWAKADLGDYQ